MTGYRHPGDGASPREIVTALHERIAARSPEHARLVARFARVQAGLDAETVAAVDLRGAEAARRGRLQRIRDYSRLRAGGMSREDAASRIGVGPDTAQRYEAALRRQAGGPPAWLA